MHVSSTADAKRVIRSATILAEQRGDNPSSSDVANALSLLGFLERYLISSKSASRKSLDNTPNATSGFIPLLTVVRVACELVKRYNDCRIDTSHLVLALADLQDPILLQKCAQADVSVHSLRKFAESTLDVHRLAFHQMLLQENSNVLVAELVNLEAEIWESLGAAIENGDQHKIQERVADLRKTRSKLENILSLRQKGN